VKQKEKEVQQQGKQVIQQQPELKQQGKNEIQQQPQVKQQQKKGKQQGTELKHQEKEVQQQGKKRKYNTVQKFGSIEDVLLEVTSPIATEHSLEVNSKIAEKINLQRGQHWKMITQRQMTKRRRLRLMIMRQCLLNKLLLRRQNYPLYVLQ